MSGKPAIVWLGFHEEGRFALPAIVEQGFHVKAIISLTKTAAARRSGVYDFAALSRRYNIPYHEIEHINHEASLELLRNLAPDVLCVIGWSQILSASALRTAGITIGAHASLLPEGKGSAPINWALIKGLKRTGNTLICLTEAVDRGDILAQCEFEIADDDTCATLYDKVAESNATMLLDVLEQIRRGTLQRRPQGTTSSALWPRRRPEDGIIDWNQSSEQIYNFIRALTRPYPGAFGFVSGVKVIIWRATREQTSVDVPAGSIWHQRQDGNTASQLVGVRCTDGGIILNEIEVPGSGILQGEKLIEFFENVRAFD